MVVILKIYILFIPVNKLLQCALSQTQQQREVNKLKPFLWAPRLTVGLLSGYRSFVWDLIVVTVCRKYKVTFTAAKRQLKSS